MVYHDKSKAPEAMLEFIAVLKEVLVNELAAVFANNRTRLRYLKYRAFGLQIGSGLMESTCKQTFPAVTRHSPKETTELEKLLLAGLRSMMLSGVSKNKT